MPCLLTKNLYIQTDSSGFKEFMDYIFVFDAMTHSLEKRYTTFMLIIFVSSLKDLFTWNLTNCSLSKPMKKTSSKFSALPEQVKCIFYLKI